METALSDLLNFFRIHANASVTNHGKGYANHTQSPRSRSPGGGGLGGGGGVRGSTGDRTRGAGGGREARRGYGDLDDRARDAKQEGRQDEEEEDEKWLLRGCPPLFKVPGGSYLDLEVWRIFLRCWCARYLSSLSEQFHRRLQPGARPSPYRRPTNLKNISAAMPKNQASCLCGVSENHVEDRADRRLEKINFSCDSPRNARFFWRIATRCSRRLRARGSSHAGSLCASSRRP